MKKANSILATILVLMTGCGGNKQSTEDFITVDVTASYPEKELILQDFMDVEYIALETTDEFITQGVVEAVGKEILLVTNRNNDGDIFVFAGNGKALRKINRKGQGGEEYSHTTGIVLDENNNELFVIDYPARKIPVYDLYGNFKRSFKFADTAYYTSTFNYDRDHLICYKSYYSTESEPCHLIISKQDGSIVREIQIPFKEIKKPIVTEEINGQLATAVTSFHQIIPYHGNWALVEASSDTVYSYFPDEKIVPFIVRTPSVYSMDPEVFLSPSVLTDRYYFMRTIKKKFDFAKMTGFPINDLVYDKQENAVFRSIVYNDDFSNKKGADLWSYPVNHEIATWQPLEAYRLVEAYKEGQLKGKLKDIAATLDEESNPVIMLIKYKK